MTEDGWRSHGQDEPQRRAVSAPGLGYAALSTGTRIDQYIIQSVLGSGGFGITYLAEHIALGKLFAIKEYFPRDFAYRDGTTVRPLSEGDGTYRWGRERFLQEAQALARFRHPSIVDVTNVLEANGTAYMVLSYEEGPDLKAWAGSLGRPPSQEEADRIARPLLDALDLMHQSNLLHRDVSPDNIIVRAGGDPVLIDFGSARDAVRGRQRAMSMVVKHGYSPPEQYTSDPGRQGPWTDIYALAATLYFLVVGSRPMDATARFVEEGFQPATVAAKGVYRRAFLEAIDVGMTLQPEGRPSTIGHWRGLLFRASVVGSPAGEGSKAAGAENADAQGGEVDRGLPPARPSHGSSRARSQPRVFTRRNSDASRKSVPPSNPLPSPAVDPDWSVDDPLAPGAARAPVGFWETTAGRSVAYGLIGALTGIVAGALTGVVAAGLFQSDCFSDNCIWPFVPPGAAIGAVIGLVVGVIVARRGPPVEYRSSPDDW